MRKIIKKAIKHSTNLHHVQDAMLGVFIQLKDKKPNQRIGYVAGIITSDGEENMQKNIDRLLTLTEKLREKVSFPVFSSVDIFGEGMYGQIEDFHFERVQRERAFIKFWRILLKSGHITDVFMTPRWKESKGAKDEHRTALKQGITIHYVDEELNELGDR